MKDTILIIEDSMENHTFLQEALNTQYTLISVNYKEADQYLAKTQLDLSLIILDINTPLKNSENILNAIKYHPLHLIPIVVISSNHLLEHLDEFYEQGVVDHIFLPCHKTIIQKKIFYFIQTYRQQLKYQTINSQYNCEHQLIHVLNKISELRNIDSKEHVKRIGVIVGWLLNVIKHKPLGQHLNDQDIDAIIKASSLHDIGKILIEDHILNKPERLTEQEFNIIKTHAILGANMIEDLNVDDLLMKRAYEICRWHHERYDGKGYPDGLVGDDIPLSAQIVSIADVYDALISARCYKTNYSHQQTMEMIISGQCGKFNPVLIECLLEIEPLLENEQINLDNEESMLRTAPSNIQYTPLILNRLNEEDTHQQKLDFYIQHTTNLSFSYSYQQDRITLNSRDAKRLNTMEVIFSPLEHHLINHRGKNQWQNLLNIAKNTSIMQPEFEFEGILCIDKQLKSCHIVCRTIWLDLPIPKLIGIEGMIDLEVEISSHDEAKLIYVSEEDEYGHVQKMSIIEAKRFKDALSKIFHRVRYINTHLQKELVIDDSFQPKYCHTNCNQLIECENCIVTQAMNRQAKLTKFEFLKNEIDYVITQYVEIDGYPYVLELVSIAKDNLIFEQQGNQNFVKSIQELQQKLYLDGLTGAFNRHYLEDEMYDQNKITAIAMVDLDNFKQINDTYGHGAGDLSLKVITGIIMDNIRKHDAIIRYGGDEFIIMFNGITECVIEERLNIIRKEIQSSKFEDYPGLVLTCSIGCACQQGSLHDLLNLADDMLYKAKQERNKVVLASKF